jgi:hypothetical protein
MVERRVTQEQFAILRRELIQMEAEGYSTGACAVGACNAAGIKPPQPFEPVEIVVVTAPLPH